MFWERFYSLCLEKGVRPNSIRIDLDVSSGTISNWKAGGEPERKTLERIASYFGVSSGYLLGYTDVRESAPTKPPGPPGTEKAPTPEGEGDVMSDRARQVLAIAERMTPENLDKWLELARLIELDQQRESG